MTNEEIERLRGERFGANWTAEQWREKAASNLESAYAEHKVRIAAEAALLDAATRTRALEEALRPFAKMAELMEGPFGEAVWKDEETFGPTASENGDDRSLRIKDFRRARAALTGETQNG